MPARILIINPKHPYKLSSPPLGIGYISAYTKANSNNTIKLFDENYIENPDIELTKIIKEEKISFVGISFPSSAILRVMDICKLVRQNFGDSIILFAGGYHPSSEPELTLRLIPDFDFIIIGEAEHIVSDFGNNWKKLDNISYLEDSKFLQNPITHHKKIDKIPYPDRAAFNNKYFSPSYGAISGIYGRVATIMSSRGCPYSCYFCSGRLIQKHIRYHSAEYVLSEIEHILNNAGAIDYLYFIDVMFLSNWERAEDLCSKLMRNGYHKKFKWAATVASNVVNAEKIRLMKEAGCFYLSFGFESASDRALKLMNKKATAKDNQQAIDICKQYSVLANSAFLFGIPGEREEDLEKTCEFVKKNNVFSTGINIMKPLPGSPFYYEFVRKGIIKPSIEQWHEISSIHIPGKIYNDQISENQYKEYKKKFYRSIMFKSKINSISANWRKRLKHFI